jgi:large subunit ribosomal protein L10
MALTREKKQALVADIRKLATSSSIIVVVKNHGLTVAESQDLRGKARASNCGIRVVKAKLAKVAIDGTDFAILNEDLTGPVALAYSEEDPVAAAKVVVDYSKNNEKLEVVCAVMDGRKMELSEVKTLASLPSLDELRGKLVGLISAPARNIACITQAPAGQLARLLKAKSEQ